MISRHVRIVLVSAGFDREITTTVLWLTDLYGLDIRCVRLTPYRVGDRLLLDVQQMIPLPEANELTIQLQRKATQERAVRGTDGRDWTQYVITGLEGDTPPLRKRKAVLTMVLPRSARSAFRLGSPSGLAGFSLWTASLGGMSW